MLPLVDRPAKSGVQVAVAAGRLMLVELRRWKTWRCRITPRQMNLRHLLDTALDAARAGIEVHRRHLGEVRVDDWRSKGLADFVTDVDHEAEERIVERIRARYPDHSLLAEEGTAADQTPGPVGVEGGTTVDASQARGDAEDAMSADQSRARGVTTEPPGGEWSDSTPPDSGKEAAPSAQEWLWVIDPLDGTTNYLHGYPAYAVSVAVLHRNEPVAGVVISGATGEEWSAVRGGGAFHDGRRIQVSGIDRLDYALIGTGFPFRAPDLLPAYLEQLDAVLRRTAGVRRAGSAAIDLCHVATGLFDGFWELVLAPWDVAAGMLIIRESGGVATALNGDLDVLRGGAILAGNPTIYEALGKVLGPLS